MQINDTNNKVTTTHQPGDDIEKRKDLEALIAESENRLRSLADSMPQLVWVADAQGHYEYFNQRWYQYTGTTGNEVTEDLRVDQVHPDERAMARRVWRHSLKTGEPYEVQYRLYHAPSGCYRWVIGRANATLDHAGKPVRWYGTCTDINEQKHITDLQEFLAEASKQMNESLDYRANLKKVAKLCVPEIADWCTVDMYDSKGESIEQVVVKHADPRKVSLAREYREHNPPAADGKSGISKVILSGKPEFYPVITNDLIEKHITDPKKKKFMLSLDLHSLIIVPIYEHTKAVGAVSFVSTDSGRHFSQNDLHIVEDLASRISIAITNAKLYDDSVRENERRKELETALLNEKQLLEQRVSERTMQLEENSKNLTRSNQELQDFAYVASHDLQEPLRKIQAFGNLLENEYSDVLGEGADYLARMRNAAARMSVLIEDLLSFSRVTTRANPSIQVDLNTVISEVTGDLESRIEETGGVVTTGDLPAVKADPTHMRQLFQNLIGNALKFHKPGQPPKVDISCHSSDDEYYEIHVRDNGIGFDQKYIDRIFAVFQRLHERGSYEGTGIGLAVCRKIVERYGGTITARSSKNKGATFIVRLPKESEVVQ